MKMRFVLPMVASGAMLLSARATFALDSGGRVGGVGGSAQVTSSVNRTPDYERMAPGPSADIAGRSVKMLVHGTPNPTQTGAYSTTGSVLNITGGKNGNTLNVVPGRNSPMPLIGGMRTREHLGDLGP